MKSRSGAKRKVGHATVAAYIKAQKPTQAAVCRLLGKEIDAILPQAGATIYHGIPVWFIAGNAVVGFNVNAKKQVNLLFWNGQAIKSPSGLEAVGKFKAAQVQFSDVEEVDKKKLKKWLKVAGKKIWDYAGMRKKRVAKK